MKIKLPLVFLIFTISFFNRAQNFTWVRGDNFSGVGTGTYGTIGVPSVNNDPGHRHGCGHWVDVSGNLWLYGGEGYSTSSTTSWLGDLWRYNTGSNEWTWMKGSSGPNSAPVYGTLNMPSSTNDPGAREFTTSWTDNNGNFWMFGGANNAGSGFFGDLWKYTPSNNMWTWMSGFNTQDVNGIYGTLSVPSATNQPGCRYAAASWVDANNNLWMFGGRGFAATGGASLLNDLWRFNTTTNQWTWMGGSNLASQNGVYGTLNVPSTLNIPGALEFPASWVGNNGQFYLFSGRGYVSSGPPGYTADLWRYNPATGEWTWLKGPNLTNQNSVYGTLGVSSASTHPGGRYSTASWKDANGDFWVFGGLGFASTALGSLNDLYKYNVATNQFTWMKGGINPLTNGNYGPLGVPLASNVPGSRFFNTYWSVGSNLWLIGGEGVDITPNNANDNMNDLWVFSVPCNPDSVLAGPSAKICSGSTVSLTAYNQYPSNVQWYSSPTSTLSVGSGSVLTVSNLTAAANSSVYNYYSQSNSCTLAPRTAISITVNALPQISITGNTAVCAGSQVTLVAGGAQSYTWANGSFNPILVASPGVNTTYSVSGSNSLCSNNATFNVVVNPLPTLTVTASHTIVCLNYNQSAVLSASGALTYTWSTGFNTPSATVTPTGTPSIHTYTVVGSDINGCKNSSTLNIDARICGGIDENKRVTTLQLFPNPNSGAFTVKLNTAVENARLRIMNMLGEIVTEELISGKNLTINHQLVRGVYIISLEKEANILGNARLIVE